VKIILGISAWFHDAAAALVVDGTIVAAAQEERFNRVKNSSEFPAQAIQYCLQEAGISMEEVDTIVFYEKPFLKFERLLETYYHFAPKGFLSFVKAMPIWITQKLAIRREFRKALKGIDPYYRQQKRLQFSSHHLSHAASAFYPSPFKESAVLVVDAVGEWSTASIWVGRGKDLQLLKEMRFPDSVGLLYSAFTYFLGFEVNNGEYKLMGLSPFGNENGDRFKRFDKIIREELVTIYEDGSIQLRQQYFSYAYGLRMVPDRKWEKLFGIPRRKSGEDLHAAHADLALAIQRVTEEIMLKMAAHAKALTDCENICLAGGVALNCVANGKLSQSGLFKKVWVQPAAGDAGGALGAALAFYHTTNEKEVKEPDAMQDAFLGPSINADELEAFCKKVDVVPSIFEAKATLHAFIVRKILEGKVVGWVQGRMEYGPRALGARSILADPSHPGMQSVLNQKVKKREDFRPFAPVLLAEEAREWFNWVEDADYMQFVATLREEKKKTLLANYEELDIMKKLAVPRSHIQAVTHVDYSARLQVVKNAGHPLYGLLEEMRKQSGRGILINTSFNRNGEPIVCTMEDAWTCFMGTNIDILVLENYVFQKST
jgi:carbamoyltransferase